MTPEADQFGNGTDIVTNFNPAEDIIDISDPFTRDNRSGTAR